jgi:hypothetical protein
LLLSGGGKLIPLLALQENCLLGPPSFVNREDALKNIAGYIDEFHTKMHTVMYDTERALPSIFSVGMFGRGKTALGAQSVLQLNRRENDLLKHIKSTRNAKIVKSTWLCFVDLSKLKDQGRFTSGALPSNS